MSTEDESERLIIICVEVCCRAVLKIGDAFAAIVEGGIETLAAKRSARLAMRSQILLCALAAAFTLVACGGRQTARNAPTPTERATSAPTPIPFDGPLPSPVSIDGGASNTGAATNPAGAPPNTITPDAQGGANPATSGGVSRLSGNVSEVEGALRDLNARTIGNEIVVELPSDVLFDFDKWDIRPDAARALENLLTVIRAQSPTGGIRIEGHTDSIATDAYNMRLSERRALSVKNWLAARGGVASRITTRGFGESRPRAPNARPDGADDPEGRQQNRRVEIFVARS